VASADEFLKRLSIVDWRERHATIEQIVSLGSQAEPLVRDMLHHHLDEETRKDIQLVARRLAESRVLGASLITLHAKGGSAKDIFAELARQCSATVPTWPDGLWDQGHWPTIDFDCDRRPFWEVIRDLSKKLDVQYLSNDPHEFRISRDAGHPTAATSIDGAFLIGLNPIVFRNALVMDLSVYGEPKTVVIRAVSLKLDEATDDQGAALIPQTTRRGFGRRFKMGNRELSVPFKRPDVIDHVARLRGSMTLTVQTASENWVIDDPLSASAVTHLVDSIPVTFESLTATAAGDHYELQASIPSGWTSRGSQDELLELVHSRMRVLDNGGHPLSMTSYDSHNTNDGAEITVDFGRDPLPDGAHPGPPAKLTWDIPSETRDLVVPFDFKDVPIVDPFDQ
jgi:hypothetical protein